MVGGSRKGNRKRWATKVKSGCITCKRRKIKCDEGKPTCQRCTVRDTVCEGYENFSYRPPGTNNQAQYANNGYISSSSSESASSSNPQYAKDGYISSSSSESASSSNPQYANNDYISSSSSESAISSSNSDILPYRTNPGSTSRYTAETIGIWVSRTHSPFETVAEQQGLKTWLELMPGVARSEVGLRYWTVAIPTFAWSFPAVKYAMTAAAMIFASHVRKDPTPHYLAYREQACQYARRSISELLTQKSPPEVTIILSTLFWIFELIIGDYVNAMCHLATGAQLAAQTKEEQLSVPLVAQYVHAFVSGFPRAINPKDIRQMSANEQKDQFRIRHQYARPILDHALSQLSSIHARVIAQQITESADAQRILGHPMRELQYIISSFPLDDGRSYSHEEIDLSIEQVIEQHSPFIGVLHLCEMYLQDYDLEHIRRFEVEFRPTLDQFLSLVACRSLALRQLLSKLLAVQRPSTKLSKRALSVGNG